MTHIPTDESTHCNYFTPDIHLQSEFNHSHTHTLTFSNNKPDWQQLYRHPQLVINKVLTATPAFTKWLPWNTGSSYIQSIQPLLQTFVRKQSTDRRLIRHTRVARLFLSVHHPPVTTRLSPTHCFSNDKPPKTCDTHFHCTFAHHSLLSQHDSRPDVICQCGWRQPCTLTSLCPTSANSSLTLVVYSTGTLLSALHHNPS